MRPNHLISRLVIIFLLGGCASDTVSEAPAAEFTVAASVAGVNLGKYDDVAAIATWQVKENQDQTRLEGLNRAGEQKFAAVIDSAPANNIASVQFIGQARCVAQVDLAEMKMIETTCSGEQIRSFEGPATQLIDTFTPLVSQDALKSDGLFTKAACVGAGIGAAVLTVIAWEFVAGASAVGTTLGSIPAMLVAGGSIVGAVATCYTAFAKPTSFGECISDCDGEVQCLSGCASDLIESADPRDNASNYMLCLGNCDGDDCDRFCIGLFTGDEDG